IDGLQSFLERAISQPQKFARLVSKTAITPCSGLAYARAQFEKARTLPSSDLDGAIKTCYAVSGIWLLCDEHCSAHSMQFRLIEPLIKRLDKLLCGIEQRIGMLILHRIAQDFRF